MAKKPAKKPAYRHRHSPTKLRDGGSARRVLLQEQDSDVNERRVSLRPTAKAPTKPNRRGTNATSLANLKRGTDGGPAPLAAPKITVAVAELFVKLRTAGVPDSEAILVCMQGASDKRPTTKQLEGWITEFERSSLVADAYKEFNGAAWQDLDDESRTDVALRVHIAQCAYVLYSSDISNPLANMKKIEYAKSVITEKIALEKESGGNDKFTQFMQELVNNATAGMPPTFKKESAVLPALPVDFTKRGN